MKESRKHCINCVNLKHTGEFVFHTPVYTCDIIRGVVDPISCCNYFQEITALYKKPVPPILKPHEKGFRGFSETFSSFIKTKEGQVISV